MDKSWFYAKGSPPEKLGPHSENQMRALIISGQVQPHDLVWSEGMDNWAPLAHVPEFQQSLASSPTRTTAQLPPGLLGWMTFVGTMTIIGGILSCLACVYIVTGIPMIIGGFALLAAKDALAHAPGVDPALAHFFAKLRTVVQMTGIVYIVGIVSTALAVALYFVFIAAGVASALGGS